MRNEKDFKKIMQHEIGVLLFIMTITTTAVYIYLKLKGLY
jgi:hypothetical protein